MTRIAIMDRADMNAEQARVYDTAKQSSGIVGGPYTAYIRLPRLFEACQNLRACLSSALTCTTAVTAWSIGPFTRVGLSYARFTVHFSLAA